MYHHYSKSLKDYARQHRKSIWAELLSKRQMKGYAFLRQRPITGFIADFFCKELKLVIEVDGISHSWEISVNRDFHKDATLERLGYSVLRFEDEDVIGDINRVRECIEDWIESRECSDHPP